MNTVKSLCTRLTEIAKKVGLHINERKIEDMVVSVDEGKKNKLKRH